MSKNSWFKHYNSAHEGLSIQALINEKDHEALACYWILLELISRYEHEDRRGFIEIPVTLLSKRWGVTCPKVERILNRLSLNFRSTFDCTLTESSPKVASILIRNWLEFQGTWGGKRQARFEQDSTDLRLKTEDKRLKTEDAERRSEIQKLLADAGIGERDAERENQRGLES